MKKLQQYRIFKFDSDRLKEVNNNVHLTLQEGYANGEVVSLGESELIRIINRVKNKDISYSVLDDLLKERRWIKKLQPSRENRKRIVEINAEIDDFIFIPEIVNVQFTDPRHYRKIIKDGLFVNGKKYIRLLAGSGMTRRSTIQFVEEEFGKLLKPILQNDRNKKTPLVDSKFNAYYALVSSAGHSVTTPRFCVVPDYKFTKDRLVDYVVEPEDGEDYVEERLMPITTNAFDGQGIISLDMAGQWARDLELDYTPNSFCIRGAYLKGQCVAFDFHRFAEELSDTFIVKDVWGNDVDVRDVDCILTESQLKLWNAYDSCDQYQSACEKNQIGWSISRASPKKEKDYFYSSYQLLQVLDLTKEEIENMCRPTIDWISKVSTGDVNYAMLYLVGSSADRDTLEKDWFDEINDFNLKALMLNHDLFGDAYFRKNVYHSLNKKVKESRMGKLLFPGNWQVAISDPYAFCEYIFGKEVNGLLAEHENYCQYWNDRDIDTVAVCRSPLTWKSEMNVMKLKNNAELDKWFGHIRSGIIINIHGVDTMLFSDSD